MATYESMRATYSAMLKNMLVKPEWHRAIERAATTIQSNRDRYVRVEEATGVPWRFIAVLHWRESSGDFRGVLHNGERILGTGRKTRLVPAGRGPFETWEEAAIDALTMPGKRLDQIKEWPLERICWEGEKFNGLGYLNRGLPSPYLWSGTNQYQRGKYVSDGAFSAGTVDQQMGIIALYVKLSETVTQPDAPTLTPQEETNLSIFKGIRVAAKSTATAAAGWFTLDNLDATKNWLDLGSKYIDVEVLGAIFVGGAVVWVLVNAMEGAQNTTAVATDIPLKSEHEEKR